MEILTEISLRLAIEFAGEHHNTSIGVILDNETTAAASHRNILYEYRNLRDLGNKSVGFSNGSSIRCIGINSLYQTRGCRFNFILLHSLIDTPRNRGRVVLFEHSSHGHPGYFYHYDILSGRFYENTFAYEHAHEGIASGDLRIEHDIILDEFVLINVDARDSYIHVENGSAICVTSKAPDLGEFAPSQELQNFLNDLV